jgi:hypothetical protein
MTSEECIANRRIGPPGPANGDVGGGQAKHRGTRWSRPVRWMAGLLAGTAITGIALHPMTPHGDSIDTLGAAVAGAPVALRVVHVALAAALAASMLWHLHCKRRRLIAFAKRRRGRSLRLLLAAAALTGLMAASLVTGFSDGAGHVEHHTAVSIALSIALAVHAWRRMAPRCRTAGPLTALNQS